MRARLRVTVAFLVVGFVPHMTPNPAFGAPPSSSCEIDPVLKSLEVANPIDEARASIARGDFVLLGVCEFGCYAPGVPSEIDCWTRELGVVDIPDTTDGIRCEEHGRLQQVARSFAEAYNRFILAEYRRRHPDRCAA